MAMDELALLVIVAGVEVVEDAPPPLAASACSGLDVNVDAKLDAEEDAIDLEGDR